MKKVSIILLVISCVMLLASCEAHVHNFGDVQAQCTADTKAECQDCGEIVIVKATGHTDANLDGVCDVCGENASTVVVHVKTLDDLKAAPAQALSLGTKSIALDNDIAWPSSQTEVVAIDMTGLVFDMGGHSITDIKQNALNFTGDSFAIRNGSFLASSDNTRYSLSINYSGSNATTDALRTQAQAKIPASYTDSDNVWKKRVILDHVTATACLIGYSTAEVKDCSFTGGAYRGLVFQGTSGILENSTVLTASTASSGGFVSHSYGETTLKGTVSIKGAFGGYASQFGVIRVDAAANVTFDGFKTYGLYIEKGGSVTLNSGCTLKTPADNHVHFGTDGGTFTQGGATLKDKTGATVVALVYDGTGTVN